MALKALLFRLLLIGWRFERRILSDRIRFGLGMNLRRAYWHSRLESLGSDTGIAARVVIHQPNHVSIGSRCSIAEFVHIWGAGGVTVGDNVLIASHVAITSMTHDPSSPVFSKTTIKKKIRISDNVWIGTGAAILPGVQIGSGSIVAAGAVVTKDVPERCIVAGVPARLIRRLSNFQD